MLKYDFCVFSPPEFEEFSRDILQEHLGLYFESFSDGKDEGIDFRYSVNHSNTIIIQCKRYQEYKALFNELKKEVKKVERLLPSRYILTTSVDLSKHQKDEIVKLFQGFIKNSDDILGSKDINNLLSIYIHLEKKYYKLWISSTHILESILNGSTVNKSEFTREDIVKNIKLYVQNESLNEAFATLKQHNYVIISGIPGIGKTTLAKMLIYFFVNDEYQLIQVSRDIDEAEKSFVEGKKQVFYYDDFLGKVFLEQKLLKNEEARIMQFMRKVKKDSNKKIIMSTREYIFKQAQAYYEEFERLESCIIDLGKYNAILKAKILYNHLFFSDVPQHFVMHLIENDNFFKIINHRNYSPRIIEFLTFDYERYCDKEEQYFITFINLLENPKELWKKPFENHISSISRYILYTLLTFGGYADVLELKLAFENHLDHEREKYSIIYEMGDYEKSLAELNKSFISVKDDSIEFQNPSIQDFLLYDISTKNQLIQSLINSSLYFDQIFTIFHNPINKKFNNNKIGKVRVNPNELVAIQKVLLERFDILGYSKYGRSNSVYSSLDKLDEMSVFFPLQEYVAIKKLFISKLELELIDSENKNSSFWLSRTLELISYVYDELSFDKRTFITHFITSINSLDDIDDSILLKEIFSEEFEGLFNEIEIKFEDIIDSEVSSVDEEDLDDLNELKDKIEEIERELNMIFLFQVSDLEEKIESLEKELEGTDDNDKLDNKSHIRVRERTLNPAKDVITDLFRSFKKEETS